MKYIILNTCNQRKCVLKDHFLTIWRNTLECFSYILSTLLISERLLKILQTFQQTFMKEGFNAGLFLVWTRCTLKMDTECKLYRRKCNFWEKLQEIASMTSQKGRQISLNQIASWKCITMVWINCYSGVKWSLLLAWYNISCEIIEMFFNSLSQTCEKSPTPWSCSTNLYSAFVTT